MTDEFKYSKKMHKGWSTKRSDGNYGSNDQMGSITIEVKFNEPDEYGVMLENIYQMKDLDEQLIEFLESKKDIFIKAEPTNMQVFNEKTNPPPKPKGQSSITSLTDEQLLKIEEYQSVSAYLESVGFTSKTWDDGGVSWSRQNEEGMYIAFSLTKNKDRVSCKVGGDWYRVSGFGEDTDLIVANVNSVWERTSEY